MKTITEKQLRELERVKSQLDMDLRDVFKENDWESEYFRISTEYWLNMYLDIELHRDDEVRRYVVARMKDWKWSKIFKRSFQWFLNYNGLAEDLHKVAIEFDKFLTNTKFI